MISPALKKFDYNMHLMFVLGKVLYQETWENQLFV